MDFKIAIIGAGPAGCMLGRLLHLSDYQAEVSCNVRTQGGTLDLNKKSGRTAIKAAGLYEKYVKLCQFDASALGLYDKKARVFFQMGASEQGNPEIDRSELRSLLAESLPEGMIRWNKKLRKVGENLELHFDDSIESGFDMVIGAEGAWSKVRDHLSNGKPFFSGVAGYSLWIPKAAETAPEVSKFVNRGSIFSYSDGKSINFQQMGDSSINVTIWLRQDDQTHSGRRELLPRKTRLASLSKIGHRNY